MNYKNNIELIKSLINNNTDLIKNTALSNCHCIGLNSFVINESPKIRLFIAEPICELYKKHDHLNPIIPIHAHKYNDIFTQLEGYMFNHLYSIMNDVDITDYNTYKYSRLSDKISIENIGKTKLNHDYTRIHNTSESNFMESKTLHTASLKEIDGRCSWMITELDKDDEFTQLTYSSDLHKRSELYKNIKNPIKYLKNYFTI